MKTVPANKLYQTMNEWGKQRHPFVFLVDAFAENGWISTWEEAAPELLWQTARSENAGFSSPPPQLRKWEITPVAPATYQKGFDQVMQHIRRGDTFLLNYTQPTQVDCNLDLHQLFQLSQARYKVHLRGEFTCFSPETFVKIDNGIIAAYPMKGTAEVSAGSPNDAEQQLLADGKELAEHHTIVDLIRNDLSQVASQVTVKKFRYTERLRTNRQELIQVSSEITGQLGDGWPAQLGDIFSRLLPAGSVTGAPKPKTTEIIRQAEKYERGWYTGVFGLFDGQTLDSTVLIRFVENNQGKLRFKSGGGITFQSNCEQEYAEMIKKVYVPVA